MISSLVFVLLLITAIYCFTRRIQQIRKRILAGRPLDLSDRPAERWKTLFRVALGQGKMFDRPLSAVFHLIIYAGFIIINIEVLEIIIDGIFGTHRVFSFLGGFYSFLIASFEYLAAGVLLACIVFLARRNLMKIPRFWTAEMKSWPRNDANIILITEIFLMTAFLVMNASDHLLQVRGFGHYVQAGSFPVSSLLHPMLDSLSSESLVFLERFCWWFHIIGILAFLNYVPYSKHLHILLAFPNTYYSNLNTRGRMRNMEQVTREVQLMLDPSAAVPASSEPPERFGARDVNDLTWKQIMESYSCTECGRCTSVCPANLTGKKLSPRKIMMDVRDRSEELGSAMDSGKIASVSENVLLGNYISEEELWACTSCNACVEACPVTIDPLSIILDMRRFLVMEESKAPAELNGMFTRIENNGAPWQFPASDRLNWTQENS